MGITYRLSYTEGCSITLQLKYLKDRYYFINLSQIDLCKYNGTTFTVNLDSSGKINDINPMYYPPANFAFTGWDDCYLFDGPYVTQGVRGMPGDTIKLNISGDLTGLVYNALHMDKQAKPYFVPGAEILYDRVGEGRKK